MRGRGLLFGVQYVRKLSRLHTGQGAACREVIQIHGTSIVRMSPQADAIQFPQARRGHHSHRHETDDPVSHEDASLLRTRCT
eukprot:4287687-Pyramimonas_sp.AAC.1